MTLSVRSGFGRYLPVGSLLVLALGAMGGSLWNGWVQDDPPLILNNPAVHDWSGLTSGFTAAYWPAPSVGGLYRPLARGFHTLQWMATDGHLLTFRLTDLLLYLALTLAVLALARELLTPRQAWIAAALFAVHPVHVEAVAAAVNQAELIVALAACLAGAAWLRWMQGKAGTVASIAAVTALFLVALGFKEHAVIIPALLVALELAVGAPSTAARRRRWGTIAGLFLLGALWWGVRTAVLGSLAGAAPVEGLRDAGFGARALTMLGVAGEWTRLLFWPARLQGDYSPWEIAPWDGWQGEQTAGVLAVIAFGLALGLAWRRRPGVAFGLLWIAIGLAPVANLIVPTGILLAERTLLLASVGIVLAIAGLIPDATWEDGRWRLPLAAALGTLLLLGTVRSATRMLVWRDRDTYLAALRTDAPESWRTMVGAGIAEMEAGRRTEGERLLLAAHIAWPGSPRPIQVLAFYHRLAGACVPAVPLLEQALWMRPDDRWTRVPLVACLLDLGRYAEARAVAVIDTAPDLQGRVLLTAAATADSAIRHHAPPHTVRLAPMPGGLTIIGPTRRPGA